MVAGVAAGLSFYTYLPNRLLPLALFPVFLLFALNYRSELRARRVGILLLVSAAIVVIAPLSAYFIAHPAAFFQRAGQVSILDNPGGLLDNAVVVAKMFFFAGDTNPRNNIPGRPTLDWLLAGPFLIGLLAVLWRPLRPVPLLLLSWLVVMLLPTVLSEDSAIVPARNRGAPGCSGARGRRARPAHAVDRRRQTHGVARRRRARFCPVARFDRAYLAGVCLMEPFARTVLSAGCRICKVGCRAQSRAGGRRHVSQPTRKRSPHRSLSRGRFGQPARVRRRHLRSAARARRGPLRLSDSRGRPRTGSDFRVASRRRVADACDRPRRTAVGCRSGPAG